MRAFNCIAFFWVGQDTTLPSLLVRSIRLAFGPDFCVYQLSDRQTPAVAGVTHVKHLKLSPHIMVARLEAYAALPQTGATLLLDADMLVLRAFALPPLNTNEVGITHRGARDTIRFSPREWAEFPEFTDKDSSDVMPYIYSFIYVESSLLFVRQLIALRKLPKRFHRWYGDQMSLKSELDAPDRFRIQTLDIDQFNRTVRSEIEFREVFLSTEAPYIVHFKGPESKSAMARSLSLIQSRHGHAPGSSGT